MKVLLAEDNRNMRQLLRQLLSVNNSDIREAMDGQEAVQLYSSVRPDLVVMDIAMPVLSGIEATRRILAEHPDAKVVIVTVMDDQTFRRAAERAGATAFFGKEDLINLQDYVLQLTVPLPSRRTVHSALYS